MIEDIIKQMESGELFWRASWDASKFCPHNPVSNLCYKGGNRLRLTYHAMKNEYQDNRWCTFKQAMDSGWKIKPGEKAILLEKWIFHKVIEVEDKDTGKKEKEIIPLKKPIVNYFYVFNAQQIEGMPPLSRNDMRMLKEEDAEMLKVEDTVVASSECPINYIEQDRAYYSVVRDEITMPPKESFFSTLERLSVTLHEMGHSTGHSSRLNREFGNCQEDEKYAIEELRAELGSIFVMAELGLPVSDKMMENHSAYLQSWVKALKADYNEFFRASRDAQEICERLKDNYDRLLQKEISISADDIKNADLSFLSIKKKERKVKDRAKENSYLVKKKNVALEK